MRWLYCLMLFVSAASFAADVHDRLLRIESLALSEWNTSKILLSEVDASQLSVENKAFYDYLSIYLSTKDTPFEQLSEQYKTLYLNLPAGDVKVKLTKSLLALSAYTNDWEYAFTLSRELETQLESIDQPSTLLSAWRGMLVFYTSAGLNDMALDTIEKINNSASADDATRCYANTMAAEMALHVGDASERQFNDAIDQCKRAGQSYYTAFNYVHLLDFYVSTSAFSKARIIEKEAKWRVEDTNFLPMTTSFRLSQATMRLSENDVATAERIALLLIQQNVGQEYEAATKGAYTLLIEIAELRQDYAAAYEYLKKRQIIEQQLTSEESIRALAFQKATFDLANKENEILILDKQNRLLQTEALYNNQKMKTTMLALSMVSVIGVALLLWSYRSRKLARKLRYLATRDSLTGLYNRGYFSELASAMLKRAQRNDLVVSMILLDLDLFKGLNDTYGHQVGDWVLREVSTVLKTHCPKNGLVTRMGGEEFGLLVDDITLEGAYALAEQCRQAIEAIDSSLSGHKFEVSASFGVSASNQVGYSLDNLLSASDLALYQSKRSGRNQVFEYKSNLTQLG